MTPATTVFMVIAAMAGLAGSAFAQSSAATPGSDEGFALLNANCARCHAIGQTGASPLEAAPPFRTLARKYPLENLSEALAEGIMTGHPAMPQFEFKPAEIGAILAYLLQIAEP